MLCAAGAVGPNHVEYLFFRVIAPQDHPVERSVAFLSGVLDSLDDTFDLDVLLSRYFERLVQSNLALYIGFKGAFDRAAFDPPISEPAILILPWLRYE